MGDGLKELGFNGRRSFNVDHQSAEVWSNLCSFTVCLSSLVAEGQLAVNAQSEILNRVINHDDICSYQYIDYGRDSLPGHQDDFQLLIRQIRMWFPINIFTLLMTRSNLPWASSTITYTHLARIPSYETFQKWGVRMKFLRYIYSEVLYSSSIHGTVVS